MGFTSPSPGPRRINRSGSTFVGRRPYLVGGSDEGSRTDGEQPIAVLEQLLTDKGEQLLRTAILLAGSRSDGEDLLQNALERVIQRWRTIRGEPEGYLRQTLYHLAVDGWRRKKAWRGAPCPAGRAGRGSGRRRRRGPA